MPCCMAIVPADVDILSDDDAGPRPAAIDALSDEDLAIPAPPEKPKYVKRKSLEFSREEIQEHRRRLRVACDRKCSCKLAACRQSWKESQADFESLLHLRLEIHQLPKLDADNEVSLWNNILPFDFSFHFFSLL